jgi:hypothetical protein
MLSKAIEMSSNVDLGVSACVFAGAGSSSTMSSIGKTRIIHYPSLLPVKFGSLLMVLAIVCTTSRDPSPIAGPLSLLRFVPVVANWYSLISAPKCMELSILLQTSLGLGTYFKR